MYSIRQLMKDKSDSNTYSISPEASIKDALTVMADKNIGAVMVEENGQMVGIFTERDFARKAIQTGKCTLDTQVKNVMTQVMYTIHPEQSLEECMGLMTEYRIRHLPIMEKGRLIGMVSMRDVVQALISKKDTTIEKLESYILGTEYGK